MPTTPTHDHAEEPVRFFDRARCPVCDAVPAASLPAPAPWRLAWCAECRFAYITNPPRYESLATEFEWQQSAAAEQQRRQASHGRLGSAGVASFAALKRAYRGVTRRDKLLALATRFGFSGEVVDVGCGDGHLWDSLPAGCTPVGIEVSPALAAQARSRLGSGPGRVIEADALSGLQQIGDARAGGAILNSYLEHEAQPLVAMRELRRVLQPGAAAILKMPNYASWNRVVRGPRWCGFRFPDHVNYFTPRALRRIVVRAGFEVARFAFRDRAPTSDNMWCVIRVPR